MADQNDQQTQPQPSQPATTAPPSESQEVTNTLLAPVKQLWTKYGIFFIIVGVLLIALKFGNLAMDVLGWSSKKDLQDAQKKDTELKAQEDAASSQADSLVTQANNLPNQEGPVDADWNLKK
jgi:hypothetical protein